MRKIVLLFTWWLSVYDCRRVANRELSGKVLEFGHRQNRTVDEPSRLKSLASFLFASNQAAVIRSLRSADARPVRRLFRPTLFNPSNRYAGLRSPVRMTDRTAIVSTAARGKVVPIGNSSGNVFDSDVVLEILKSDIPRLLHREPTWEIFANDLKVIDETGVAFDSLQPVKALFRYLRGTADHLAFEDRISVVFVTHGSASDIHGFLEAQVKIIIKFPGSQLSFAPPGADSDHPMEVSLRAKMYFNERNQVGKLLIDDWRLDGWLVVEQDREMLQDWIRGIEEWARDIADNSGAFADLLPGVDEYDLSLQGERPTWLRRMKNKLSVGSEDTPVWSKDEFNPSQNTIFIDVDDTIVTSSNFLAGMDTKDNQAKRSIEECDVTAGHCVYPNALEFINALSSQSEGRNATRSGNVFVASARPRFAGSKVIKLFNDLQYHEPDRLTRAPLGFLWGSQKHLARLAKRGTCVRASELLGMNRNPAKTKKLRVHYEALGDFKVEGIRRQMRDIRKSFPLYETPSHSNPFGVVIDLFRNVSSEAPSRSGMVFFVGDNGQGDLHAGAKLLDSDLVHYVFIHDVRNLRNTPVEEWSSKDPEAAGVSAYRRLPERLRERIFLFHNYEQALARAREISSDQS